MWQALQDMKFEKFSLSYPSVLHGQVVSSNRLNHVSFSSILVIFSEVLFRMF